MPLPTEFVAGAHGRPSRRWMRKSGSHRDRREAPTFLCKHTRKAAHQENGKPQASCAGAAAVANGRRLGWHCKPSGPMKPKLHEPTWAADPQNDPIGWKEEKQCCFRFGVHHNRYRATADLKTRHRRRRTSPSTLHQQQMSAILPGRVPIERNILMDRK